MGLEGDEFERYLRRSSAWKSTEQTWEDKLEDEQNAEKEKEEEEIDQILHALILVSLTSIYTEHALCWWERRTSKQCLHDEPLDFSLLVLEDLFEGIKDYGYRTRGAEIEIYSVGDQKWALEIVNPPPQLASKYRFEFSSNYIINVWKFLLNYPPQVQEPASKVRKKKEEDE